MFGSNVLEIAIGLVFIYLLLSLFCTVINEGIATALEQRGKNLLAGIKNLLNDPEFTSLAQHIYNHGLVSGVMEGATDFTKANRLPSYIAPTTFALALIDILGSHGAGRAAIAQKERELALAQNKSAAEPNNQVFQKAVADAQIGLAQAKGAADDLEKRFAYAGEAAKKLKQLRDFGKSKEASDALQSALAAGRALASEYPDPLGSIQKGIEGLSAGHTKQSLLAILDRTRREMALVSKELRTAENAVQTLQRNLESWFNDAMDRFAGWYKRWSQLVSLALAIMLVVLVNADTIMLTNRLARDAALRSSIVAAADSAAQKMNGDFEKMQAARQELLEESEKLNLPLGWIDPMINGKKDPFADERFPSTAQGWAWKLMGLLLSALAVSLGAPFWFDTLSKFMNVRTAGKVPSAGQAPSNS
jgi:hypothetical protein